MKVPDSVMEHIRSELESLEYGRVIIEIQATSNKIDVVTESRQRFPAKEDRSLALLESK